MNNHENELVSTAQGDGAVGEVAGAHATTDIRGGGIGADGGEGGDRLARSARSRNVRNHRTNEKRYRVEHARKSRAKPKYKSTGHKTLDERQKPTEKAKRALKEGRKSYRKARRTIRKTAKKYHLDKIKSKRVGHKLSKGWKHKKLRNAALVAGAAYGFHKLGQHRINSTIGNSNAASSSAESSSPVHTKHAAKSTHSHVKPATHKKSSVAKHKTKHIAKHKIKHIAKHSHKHEVKPTKKHVTSHKATHRQKLGKSSVLTQEAIPRATKPTSIAAQPIHYANTTPVVNTRNYSTRPIPSATTATTNRNQVSPVRSAAQVVDNPISSMVSHMVSPSPAPSATASYSQGSSVSNSVTPTATTNANIPFYVNSILAMLDQNGNSRFTLNAGKDISALSNGKSAVPYDNGITNNSIRFDGNGRELNQDGIVGDYSQYDALHPGPNGLIGVNQNGQSFYNQNLNNYSFTPAGWTPTNSGTYGVSNQPENYQMQVNKDTINQILQANGYPQMSGELLNQAAQKGTNIISPSDNVNFAAPINQTTGQINVNQIQASPNSNYNYNNERTLESNLNKQTVAPAASKVGSATNKAKSTEVNSEVQDPSTNHNSKPKVYHTNTFDNDIPLL